MAEQRLSAKQALFVQELLKDENAAAAAERAGYSKRRAKQAGHELLKKPQVQAALAEARRARSARVQCDADWVLEKLRIVVERCLQEEEVRDRKGNPTGMFVFDSKGANRALELLGKHLGMWKESAEPLKVLVGGALEVKSADEAWQKILRDPRAAVLLDELAQRLEAGGPLEG